jgi:hypothetical protein
VTGLSFAFGKAELQNDVQSSSKSKFLSWSPPSSLALSLSRFAIQFRGLSGNRVSGIPLKHR